MESQTHGDQAFGERPGQGEIPLERIWIGGINLKVKVEAEVNSFSTLALV
jgi:hypothetical protein